MDDWKIITVGENKYRCRLMPLSCIDAPAWASVEAFDWIDEHGWDSLPVRRVETLKAIYEKF